MENNKPEAPRGTRIDKRKLSKAKGRPKPFVCPVCRFQAERAGTCEHCGNTVMTVGEHKRGHHGKVARQKARGKMANPRPSGDKKRRARKEDW